LSITAVTLLAILTIALMATVLGIIASAAIVWLLILSVATEGLARLERLGSGLESSGIGTETSLLLTADVQLLLGLASQVVILSSRVVLPRLLDVVGHVGERTEYAFDALFRGDRFRVENPSSNASPSRAESRGGAAEEVESMTCRRLYQKHRFARSENRYRDSRTYCLLTQWDLADEHNESERMTGRFVGRCPTMKLQRGRARAYSVFMCLAPFAPRFVATVSIDFAGDSGKRRGI
jgi:hypothetical protein